jgi:hypothetical protein
MCGVFHRVQKKGSAGYRSKLFGCFVKHFLLELRVKLRNLDFFEVLFKETCSYRTENNPLLQMPAG